jgi:hypothetical protein
LFFMFPRIISEMRPCIISPPAPCDIPIFIDSPVFDYI